MQLAVYTRTESNPGHWMSKRKRGIKRGNNILEPLPIDKTNLLHYHWPRKLFSGGVPQSPEKRFPIKRSAMRKQLKAAILFAIGMGCSSLLAAYLIEVDTDGLDNGILLFSPDFAFGGDTTTASQSAPSGAIGMTGGDSIYGGNGSDFPDTYVYTHAPDSQADNLIFAGGEALGDRNYASGAAGGGAGTYAVYATWPRTDNVSGGLTHYQIETAGDSISTSVDQNGSGGQGDGVYFGNVWVKIGEIEYTSGSITVTQTPTLDMRAILPGLWGAQAVTRLPDGY